jgi:hypothetical protein
MDKLGLTIDGKFARISSLTEAFSDANNIASNTHHNGTPVKGRGSAQQYTQKSASVPHSASKKGIMGPPQTTPAYKMKYTQQRNVWRDDSYSDICHVCGVSFGFFTRRHHCR